MITPRRWGTAVLALLLSSFIHAAPVIVRSPAFTAKELHQGYRDGLVIAKPKAGPVAAVERAETGEGLRVKSSFPRFGHLRTLMLTAGDSVPAALARLRATGRYEYVEPDYIRHALGPAVVPNDPDFSQQWGLNNTGTNAGVAGADIHAEAAWGTIDNAASVIVAVVDSGVRATHQDLAANLWVNPNPGTSFQSDTDSTNGLNAVSGSGAPDDDLGHGTHVSGIIGAVGNNGVGVSGVAWKVQLMELKFIDSTGSGDIDAAITCVDYAIAHGASVINASYGSADFAQSEMDAIEKAGESGIVFVTAAGNSGQDVDISPNFPGDYPLDNIVAVGATDNRDRPAYFSNYASGSVELFAPGVGILSTYNTSDSAYAVLDGTSMSTPFVAGSIALLKAQYPNDTYRQLINRVLNAVDADPYLAGLCQTGGRLNLANALNPATSVNTPPNDSFATRAALSGEDPFTRSNNANSPATPESGTPTVAGNPGGHSLWWQWTAPENAAVEIDTSGTQGDTDGMVGGSNYDTLLGVYTGAALGALSTVATSAAYGTAAPGSGEAPVSYSEVSFHATKGMTYQINVQGMGGASGRTILAVNTDPDNDSLATPAILSGISASVTSANINATLQSGEPATLGNAGGHSLWYAWTAPRGGQAQVAGYSYDFEPEVAVYGGGNSSFGALALITAAQGQAATGTTAEVSQCLCTFVAVAGATYYIRVDGVTAQDTGVFTLSIDDSRWQAATGDSITCSPSVGTDGTVYVGSDDDTFYAYNPDGSLKWSYAAGGIFDTSSAAVVAGGPVYAGCTDGNLYAFNLDGSRKWTYTVPAPNDPSLDNGLSSSPTVAPDGTIYFKDDDGNLYAINPDGSLQWTAPVPGISYAAPVVGPDGTVYLGTDNGNGGTFFAFTADGAQKWSFTPDNAVYTAAAVDASGNVYFGSLGGTFYSLDSGGSQRWSYAVGDSITSSPALGANGNVYFGAYNGNLYALASASGALSWTYDLGNQVRASSPVVDANGVVYVGCYDHNVYAIGPAGGLVRTYATDDWVRSSPAIFGTTLYVGSNDHRLYAFDLGAGAAGTDWPMYLHDASRQGRAGTATLAITAQPNAQSLAIGAPLTLAVAATGAGPLSFQWDLNGAPIAGAINSTYFVPAANAANAGSYTVTVSQPGGSVTSAAVQVSVSAAVPGRLVNLSARAQVGTGGGILIAGFVIQGSGSKTVLLRGVGPTLGSSYQVAGALPDPSLTLDNSSSSAIASNTVWGTAANAAQIATTSEQVGAFALPAGSADSVLLTSLPVSGLTSYSAEVSGASGDTGVALAEIYDAQTSSATATLKNISARAQVGTGAGVLIAGFVITGNQPMQVLIRGIGPALSGYGVTGFLVQPQLELHDASGNVIQTNAGWGGGATLKAAFSQAGAFSLPAGSADAAMLVTLSPGSYSAIVSGVGGTEGIALVEVYQVSD